MLDFGFADLFELVFVLVVSLLVAYFVRRNDG